jgi:putative tryptophan/tyrosine transport system substrate-binding protein
MRRREFILVLVGGTAVSAIEARAEQPNRARRVGVLNAVAESDLESRAWDAVFRKRLDELGWIDGRNIHIEYRWGAGSVERMQMFAKELVRLNPDVILAVATPATAALQAATDTIPIVFTSVSDPVGSGFVASLADPGGNITGFINLEASLSSKWLELLHAIAPQVSHVGFLYNPRTAPYARYYLDTFRSAASALAVQPIEAPFQSPAEIETVMTKFGQETGAGLIIMSESSTMIYRQTIISLAERYRLPTIYPYRFYATDGGLISYGVDIADLFRGAASYVDRILRGEKPNRLPVHLPTKFEMVVNLKTAKALGLTIPHNLLVLADEVIE